MVKSHPARRRTAIVVLLAAVGLACGCVERRYTIRTDPPGAQVIVNGESLGPAPASHNFYYYGKREVTLVMDGYETKTLLQPIDAPWWDNYLTEFFTENMVPVGHPRRARVHLQDGAGQAAAAGGGPGPRRGPAERGPGPASAPPRRDPRLPRVLIGTASGELGARSAIRPDLSGSHGRSLRCGSIGTRNEGTAVKIVVAAIQMPSEPLDVAGNLQRADDLLRAAHGEGVELAVLPELFNTGYSLCPDFGPYSETADGPTITHLRRRSRQWRMAIAAGFVEREGPAPLRLAGLRPPRRRSPRSIASATWSSGSASASTPAGRRWSSPRPGAAWASRSAPT